jgi:hypothetical protein
MSAEEQRELATVVGRLFDCNHELWAALLTQALPEQVCARPRAASLETPVSPSDLTQVLASRDDPLHGWRACIIRDTRGRLVLFANCTETHASICVVAESGDDLVSHTLWYHTGQGSAGGQLTLARILAQLPDLQESTWMRMLQHPDHQWEWSSAAAASPYLPRHLWVQAVRSERASLREGAANSIHLDPDTARLLAHNDVEVVLMGLANNPATPPDVLHQLWERYDEHMHILVAKHSNCPPDVLVQMLSSRSEEIRDRALSNPRLPEEYRHLQRVLR